MITLMIQVLLPPPVPPPKPEISLGLVSFITSSDLYLTLHSGKSKDFGGRTEFQSLGIFRNLFMPQPEFNNDKYGCFSHYHKDCWHLLSAHLELGYVLGGPACGSVFNLPSTPRGRSSHYFHVTLAQRHRISCPMLHHHSGRAGRGAVTAERTQGLALHKGQLLRRW